MAPRRRLPLVFWVGSAVLAGTLAVLGFTIASDRGDDADEPPPAETFAPVDVAAGEVLRVDLIVEAMAAVEAERGGEVAYFEVNATPDLVNLFVRGDDTADGSSTAIAYVFTEEVGLADPAEPEVASGATFTSDLVSVDADSVLDATLTELPSSLARAFTVLPATAAGATPDTEGPAPAVQYRIIVDSASGGSLGVLVQGDGKILGTAAE